jgi:hypothetical protein
MGPLRRSRAQAQLKNMTSAQIAQLSPAEKLDIFNQR